MTSSPPARSTWGKPVEANIMDTQDTDFYSFLAPRDGSVTIDIQNRSATPHPRPHHLHARQAE